MTEALLDLVVQYGVVVILVSTFLSCLAMPIPSSFVMLAGGAFIASGDLSAPSVCGAAYAGAVAGDQMGYQIGRFGGAKLTARLVTHPRRAALLDRAHALIDRWGGLGVFFSVWLFSPLAPYVNVIAGTAGLKWRRYTAFEMAGEAVWVTIYVGLGYVFSGHIMEIADIAGTSVAFLAALAVTALLAVVLLKLAHNAYRARAP